MRGATSAARRDRRSGSYDRKLQTKAGAVILKVPKLRQQTFETAIIERYRRRESSVEEALIEMYLAGVSVRRVEDHRGPVGHTGQPRHGVQSQQEDLRPD
jgi:transposase-like protein